MLDKIRDFFLIRKNSNLMHLLVICLCLEITSWTLNQISVVYDKLIEIAFGREREHTLDAEG